MVAYYREKYHRAAKKSILKAVTASFLAAANKYSCTGEKSGLCKGRGVLGNFVYFREL